MDKSSLNAVLVSLVPASKGGDATRSERVAARRIVVHLWADIDAGRPCVAGSWTVRLSDDSTMPFRAWAEGVLSIREAGKAHAVAVV